MNDFIRCNKITGFHWLTEDVNKLKIKVKLKPPDDIISMPKFEDYKSESNISLAQPSQEFTFKWQEKSFSTHEIQRYSDIHNCLTGNELKYHEQIKNSQIVPNKIFTFIHEDYYTPLPQEKKKNISSLSSYLERLNLDDKIGRLEDAFGGRSGSERHLLKSQENIPDGEEQWTAMHVVFDNSDYNEDTLIVKNEAILLSLYHNTVYNYIIISPDVNNLETNPYSVETNAGELLGYQYEVDMDFGASEDGDELVTLLTKLYKKWEKKHKLLVNFVMPPLGKVQYYVTINITSAAGFEMDNLYIEYDIKLPEGVCCKDALHGRTHITDAAFMDNRGAWHFGHLIELCLEFDSCIDTPLQLYFEVISVDFWHRHRTEGYTHLPLPLTPGAYSQELRCVRPDERTGADERRFFVGGCHLMKHLEVLSNPEVQNGDYTYTETGTIQVYHTTVSQSSLPTSAPSPQYEASTASALLLGAEAALRKYTKARARLTQATAMRD